MKRHKGLRSLVAALSASLLLAPALSAQDAVQASDEGADSIGAAARTGQLQGLPGAPDIGVPILLAPIEATASRERATAPPVATITVEAADVQRTSSENPYDLFRRVTGVEVHDQGQGPGYGSNVVLRGFTSDHSSDVLLVVDGVPVNLPVHGHIEGYSDWSYLFPGAIASLRVIHGPASPLHGDFSIAGAVELYTRADAEGIEASVTGNGFGDVAGWVTTGIRRPEGGGLVGLDARRVQGWRENSTRDIGNVLLRGWRQVGDARLEGGVALHGSLWDSPGFLSISQFENRYLEHVANTSDGGKQGRAVVHGRYAAPLGPSRFLQVMAWGMVSDLDMYLTVPGHLGADGSLYQTGEADRRWGAGSEVEYSWIPRWGEITLGVSARTDRTSYDLRQTLRRRDIAEEVALDAEHSAGAIFLRWRHTVFGRLGLDLGGRIDHLRYRSFNRMGLGPDLSRDPMYPISFHIVGGQGPVAEWVGGTTTVASPKLGARLALTDGLNLMASSSRGFRSAVGVLGDPDRPPFLAWAHEIGLDYESRGVDGHVSLFTTHVANERIQDPLTLEISSAGTSRRSGFEAMLSTTTSGGVTLSGRATYTHARLSGRYADAHDDHADDAAGDPEPVSEGDGQRVPGIARYLFQVSMTTPLWREVEGRVEWRTTGPYVPIGEPKVTTEPYSLLDLGLSLPTRFGMQMDIEIRNVFDRVYAEQRSSGYVNPGTPRSLGINVRYLGGFGG